MIICEETYDDRDRERRDAGEGDEFNGRVMRKVREFIGREEDRMMRIPICVITVLPLWNPDLLFLERHESRWPGLGS